MSPLVSICMLLGLTAPESSELRLRDTTPAAEGPGGAPESHPTTVRLQVRTIPDDAELRPLQETLTGDLIMRLLEDGYRVMRFDDPADISIEIALTPQGATLEARGQGIRKTAIAPAEPSMFSIELQQWVIAFADEVRPQAELSSDAEGEPTTGPPSEAGVVISEAGEGATRAPSKAGAGISEASKGATREPPSEAGVGISEPGEGATRAPSKAGVGISEPPVDAEPPAVVATFPLPDDEIPQKLVDTRLGFTTAVLARGGMLVRGREVDGVVGLGVRFGKGRGPGATLDAEFVPSDGGVVRVLEIAPHAGFDWRFIVRQRLLVAPGVLAGAHFHRYDYPDFDRTGGGRRGLSLRARCQVGFFGTRGALLLLTAFVGYQTTPAVHRHDAGVSWWRSPLVVGLDLSVGWDFQLRSAKKRAAG